MTVLLLALGLPAAAKQPPTDYVEPPPEPVSPLTRTQPGQFPGLDSERVTPPGAYQNLPSIDESIWVVAAVRNQPYWKAGVSDPVLTTACQLGDFGSLPLNRIVVKFTGKGGRGLLQVVAPHYRHLLYDRRGLARPNEIYYFHDTGLPSCEVWVEGENKARALPKGRNTILPPPDRNALKTREALINSWPK